MGSITCSCNHASDYAAWLAFTHDVNTVFGATPEQLELFTTISILIVALILPLLFLCWLILLAWARRKDKKDADVIHRGTFTLVTMNKIRLHHRQRRLFRLLRQEAKTLPVGELAPPFVPPSTDSKYAVVRLARRFLKAIYYESSLLGLMTRFVLH